VVGAPAFVESASVSFDVLRLLAALGETPQDILAEDPLSIDLAQPMDEPVQSRVKGEFLLGSVNLDLWPNRGRGSSGSCLSIGGKGVTSSPAEKISE
jgi:hypothetical protein